MRVPLLATTLAAFLSIAALATIAAEESYPKPADFEPLTSLPWKKPGATLENTIAILYREPDLQVRYPLLAEYLRIIPAAQLGKAFDLCTHLEGTQHPEKLVYTFLRIWAARDPVACWKRTQALFHVVGIENGWLDYTEWIGEVITVQDRAAIQASPFHLSRNALRSFPLGVDQSSLPQKERVQIMREFAEKWFADFGTWPGRDETNYPANSGYFTDAPKMLEAFSRTLDELRTYDTAAPESTPDGIAAFLVAQRRLLEAKPAFAAGIIEKVQKIGEPNDKGGIASSLPGLLLLWAKLDQREMIRWADSNSPADEKNSDAAVQARGLLMSRVDAETRARWIAEAKAAPDNSTFEWTMEVWAGWDPAAAIAWLAAAKDYQTLFQVAQRLPYAGFGLNSCRAGAEVIRKFDVDTLPPDLQKEVPGEWEIILENWGEMDTGEVARYGVDTLMRIDKPEREALLKLFSGGKDGNDLDGAMPTYTLSALRVWAVTRPGEMKAWIATLKDPDLQKALTWLLNNPWGKDEEAGAKEQNP